MSTLSSNYPHSTHIRQGSEIARMLLLGGLVLIAILILVKVEQASNEVHNPQVILSQNAGVSIAVPVPTPPGMGMLPGSTKTLDPHPGQMSSPSVRAVPVPTPPRGS
jgi:hypothetical protein